MSKTYWVCGCGWKGPEGALLIAPHPFIAGDTIAGCPQCREVDEIVNCCDEPGCKEHATCGMPTSRQIWSRTPDERFTTANLEYRHLCGEHYRALDKEKARKSHA